MTIDPVQLARQLIDIPSVSGEEAAVGAKVAMLLSDLGFTVKRQPVGGDRFNVWATTGQTPRVVLCSHIDTVPPFFPSSDDGETISGRGACDTKGISAAMIAAGERLLRNGVRDFGFLFVVAEETDSIGAKKANEQIVSNSEFIVVGEPTESKFVRATKGALTATVHFDGVAAHSAYPERGDSAILKLTRAIDAIYAADWGSHEILGKATANVGVIRGGEKANIIPARAELDAIFRTVDPPEVVGARLANLVKPFSGMVVKAHGNEPMFMAVPPGEDSVVVAFNTDIPHLRAFGTPLLFGPGSILDAHTATEKIAKRDVIAAVDTYERLVAQLLRGEVGAAGPGA
jgi:acetylornithine deacetylase